MTTTVAVPLTFRYLIAGEEHELRMGPADLMRFQKHYGLKFGQWSAALVEDPGSVDLEQILYLAWLIATRTKATEQPFEDWADSIEFPDDATSGVTVGDPLESGKPAPSASRRSSGTRTPARS